MTTQTHRNRLKLRILLPIPYLFAIYLEVNDNEDVNDAISNTGRKQRSVGKKSYFAECRICGKKGRRDKIKYYVKSTHGGSTYEGGAAEKNRSKLYLILFLQPHTKMYTFAKKWLTQSKDLHCEQCNFYISSNENLSYHAK